LSTYVLRYLREVRRNGVSALAKEAMAMRSSGHLLKRAGREFVRKLIWMAVVFGGMAAFLAAATDLSLIGVMAFVGVCVVVMAAIVTVIVLWSSAHNETPLSGHDFPAAPPDRGDLSGGGWDGGGGDGGGWGAKAVFTPHRNAPPACS
jgi:hypothetical protein